MMEFEGFADIVLNPKLSGTNRLLLTRVAGDHDALEVRPTVLQSTKRLQTVDTWDPNIGHHKIEGMLFSMGQSRFTRTSRKDLETLFLKFLANNREKVLVVFEAAGYDKWMRYVVIPKNATHTLKAKLLRLEEDKRNEDAANRYDEKGEIAWGSQIRSYVLHPYQLVKDHRTDHETGNIQAVLDGDLMPFMESWLRSRMGTEADA